MKHLDLTGNDAQSRINTAAYDSYRGDDRRVALTPFGACAVRVGGTDSPHEGAVYHLAWVSDSNNVTSNQADDLAVKAAREAGATHALVFDARSCRARVVVLDAIT